MDKVKLSALMSIQKAKEFYVIMSKCTRLPFVNCNEETFDDEVFVYIDEEAGKRDVTELAKNDEQVDLIEIPQKNGLGFFSSLIALGVNSVRLDKGTKKEILLQVKEIINRSENPERIENSAFQLTAMYYMQKLRKNAKLEVTKEIKELEEEMMIHFWEGKVFLAVQEDGKKIPLLKNNQGKPYQPIFTDVHEFQKFCVLNKNVKHKAMIAEAKNMPKMIANEANGVVINPFGINLQLEIKNNN